MSGEQYGPGDRDAAYAEAAARLNRPTVVTMAGPDARLPALALLRGAVWQEVKRCTCGVVHAGLEDTDGEHGDLCGWERLVTVDELLALGFKHDDDAELQRRALRAVQRYAQHLPPGVRDVIREALGQTRPEWNRPVLRAELVDAALTWAAASGVDPIDEATTRLEQVAERYRAATTVDHEQVPGG